VLANARIGGAPLGEMDTFGYYLIVFTAGHETTRNAISGGMLALLEHPGELDKLRRKPELLPRAIDEILRWTTPVNYMARTVSQDTRFRGREFARGDTLVMFYASANRDEDVFEDPFRFRIDRNPNPHLAFGIGEHFCMGANLARRTSAALFAELLPRLEHVELAGPPERVASAFVAGLKHLPIRHRIRPAA
jgi:cytochrome P450